MTDYEDLETRALKLREHEFTFKPTMSAKDFGIVTRFGSTQIEGDFFELLSGVVRRTLVEASRKDWDALWEKDLEVPITFEELSEFVNRIVESEANRPTQSPSRSGASARTTETSSTGNSGSLAEQASTPSPSVPV
jgi:hypothetical protein